MMGKKQAQWKRVDNPYKKKFNKVWKHRHYNVYVVQLEDDSPYYDYFYHFIFEDKLSSSSWCSINSAKKWGIKRAMEKDAQDMVNAMLRFLD